MNIDLGPIGKWIGTAIAIIILGALATTGIGTLVGKGLHDTPMFFADTYYGFTGEEFTLDQETEVFGLNIVNEDWKFLGMIQMDGPYVAGRSEGALVLAGELPTDSGTTDWDTDNATAPPADDDVTAPPADDTADTAPPTDTGCNMARATLMSLKGVGDPYEVREAANAVLAKCTDSADVTNATNALSAAQADIAQLEAAEAQRKALIDNWALIEAKAANMTKIDHAGATAIVALAGGDFFFSECDGLWPGMLENVVGGGETCYVTVYPSEQIEDVATSVSFEVELSWLWEQGLGNADAGFNRIPESGVYSLSE